MNKKPVVLRSIFAILVLIVFLVSMYPLHQKDFYKTFDAMLVNKNDSVVQSVIKLAKDKQEKDKNLYPSIALEDAANEKNVSLADYIKPSIVKNHNVSGNKDVISVVRRNMAGSIRLGLDLNGGVEFFLELIPDASLKNVKEGDKPKDLDADYEHYRDVAIETLRRRLESQGIYESEISPAGQRYISLKVPVVTKEEKIRLLNLIKMSASLQFRLVHVDNDRLVQEYQANPEAFQIPVGYEKMETVEHASKSAVGSARDNKAPVKRTFFVDRLPQMDGKGIVSAGPTMDQFGQKQINLSFNQAYAKMFSDTTRQNVGRLLAIVLDGKLYSAPRVNAAIDGGHAQITGDFSTEEAKTLADALVGGSIPAKVEVRAMFDTDPTLGKETVRDGIYSGLIGTVLVMIFMAVYYLRAGMIANISLIANAVMLLGALAAFDVTLTLPGIAGVILTLGMAVDANVLIYERIREELKNNKTVQNAIDIGFDKAFSAIFDSNLTTLIVAAILMWLGTGAIKGFAITLAIGIFTTMFSAVFLTRLLFDLMTKYTKVKDLKMNQFIKETNIDFLKWLKPAIIFSITISVIFIGVAIFKGSHVLSVDFTGGTQLMVDYEKQVPQDAISAFLSKQGYESKVSYKSSGNVDGKKKLEIVIRNKTAENQESKNMSGKIVDELKAAFPDAKFSGGEEKTLGALIGKEFMKSSVLAILLAFVAMILYMSLRFEFSYSIAANIAVIHDIIVGVGAYILIGGQLSLQVVAAILTLIGFSLNDTIVNYDRIRENLKLMKNKTYKDIINASINQTLSRTILTSATVFIVLLVQLIFGGIAIRDFVFVMLIGVITGTYSSIYIAGPIVAYWHKPGNLNVKD